MSAHTRKHPTKNTLRKALIEKISRVDKEEDLVTLNFVIDKYIRPQKSSLTPEEAFGLDWIDQNKRLGKIIQGLRFRERLTQTELAKALKGVKQTNISAWESGKEKVPAKRLEQLSKIFGTDINKLMK